MKTWIVWMEGFQATGNEGRASKLGECQAETFEEACQKLCKKMSSPELFDKKQLSYWGCRLFDNEADARKNFG